MVTAMASGDAVAGLALLARRVDELFARVRARHGWAMQCRSGCTSCCRTRLSTTAVEAAWLREWLETLEAGARRALAAQASRGPTDRCAALDDEGRCSIYERRPLVCRSHGLPIRRRGARHLPVLESCSLNFTAETTPLSEVEGVNVLDQDDLWRALAELEGTHSRAAGLEAGTRFDLAELLRQSSACSD